VDMEHTSLAVAQEIHARSVAPKAIFTQALLTRTHTAPFLMLHAGLEASSTLALLEKPFGAAAKRMHVPSPAVLTATSKPQF
jgi:hypothetical protein